MTTWILSRDELEDWGDGTVILDVMEEVAQRRGGLWHRFEGVPIGDALMAHSLPARVMEP